MKLSKALARALSVATVTFAVAACAPMHSNSVTRLVNTDLATDTTPDTSNELSAESFSLKEPAITDANKAAILKKYAYVDPSKTIDRGLLAKALLYFDTNPTLFPNKSVISIVNFSIASRHVRYFNIDMKTGAVWAVHVAHGSKSDQNNDGIPEHFSNSDGSLMSSLGVFRTGEVYSSTKFKNAMRIDGLQATNNNARSRAVVVHSAWYVWESDLVAPGWTYGCFGLNEGVAPKMIEKIKNGSMIFAGLTTAN